MFFFENVWKHHRFRFLIVVQERSNVALRIIGELRKERGEMIRGVEKLCDAYIALAYMDASKHKAEKSESSEHSDAHKQRFRGSCPIPTFIPFL